MKIQPIDDRLLIQPEEEEQRVGSIIIPDSAKEKPRMGKVIAVGTDEDLKELFKEGDKVLFANYGGDEIEINGVEYLIVQRSDILAKVN